MSFLGGRKSGGRNAKANGARFEALFRSLAFSQGIAITRIPDGCRQLSGIRMIRVQSPFDFIISYQGKTALIDTKTIAGSTYTRSAAAKNKNQILELLKHEAAGVKAGYVIYARKNNETFFLPASTLADPQGDERKWNALHPCAILLGNQSLHLKRLFHYDETLCP